MTQQADGESEGSWRRLWRQVSDQRVTETVTAFGTIVAALAFAVAALTYVQGEKVARLERTSSLLVPSNSQTDEDLRAESQREAMLRTFPDRWESEITNPFTEEEARTFFALSKHPDIKPQYDDWNTARKHLNQLQRLAFAYVHGLADRKVLAAGECKFMARSNRYFGALLNVFKDEFGEGHTWQVIPQAVTAMENEYGRQCIRLFRPEDRSRWYPGHESHRFVRVPLPDQP